MASVLLWSRFSGVVPTRLAFPLVVSNHGNQVKKKSEKIAKSKENS